MERVINHLEQEKEELESQVKDWELRISNNQRENEDLKRKILDCKENIKQIKMSILELGKHD